MNDPLSRTVIGAAYRVHNQLGFGFLESIYEKALAIELERANVRFETQVPIEVFYSGEVIGNFVCDLLIDGSLIVELKSVQQLVVNHEVQLVNYLNATRTDSGLLINFGPDKVVTKRKYRRPIP